MGDITHLLFLEKSNLAGIFQFYRLSKPEKELYKYLNSEFGIKAGKITLYQLALTHSSYFHTQKSKRESNERLEFLGDAILDSIVANYVFEKFPSKSEGELTKLKSKVVSRKNLNVLALEAGLHNRVRHSLQFDTKETSILGNALEAIIGALYIDKGYRICEKVILKFLKRLEIDQVLYEQKDYKSLIHEWCQRNKKAVTFPVINESQVNGRLFYEVTVMIESELLGKGKASSKKKAQQKASREACIKLGIE